jgi:hypothetical protein
VANLLSNLNLSLLVERVGVSGGIVSDGLILSDNSDEMTIQFVLVANGAVDQAVSLGPVTTGQMVLIVSDKEVSVKFNGAAAGIAGKVFFLSGAAITSIAVSNSSGVAAKIRVHILGV